MLLGDRFIVKASSLGMGEGAARQVVEAMDPSGLAKKGTDVSGHYQLACLRWSGYHRPNPSHLVPALASRSPTAAEPDFVPVLLHCDYLPVMASRSAVHRVLSV